MLSPAKGSWEVSARARARASDSRAGFDGKEGSGRTGDRAAFLVVDALADSCIV
mgnify:CR=1 FL=1